MKFVFVLLLNVLGLSWSLKFPAIKPNSRISKGCYNPEFDKGRMELMWVKVSVLLLGVAGTVFCSLLCFTVDIIECVYRFTIAVITVIFQAIEGCPVVSQQVFFVSFLLLHKIDSLQKTSSRFKEIFFFETTAPFFLRKSFHHEAKLTSPHICLREYSVRWNKTTLYCSTVFR